MKIKILSTIIIASLFPNSR